MEVYLGGCDLNGRAGFKFTRQADTTWCWITAWIGSIFLIICMSTYNNYNTALLYAYMVKGWLQDLGSRYLDRGVGTGKAWPSKIGLKLKPVYTLHTVIIGWIDELFTIVQSIQTFNICTDLIPRYYCSTIIALQPLATILSDNQPCVHKPSQTGKTCLTAPSTLFTIILFFG